MFLAGAFGELIVGYFYRHLPLYLALIILFAAGLGLGALATQGLSAVQRVDLSNYLASVYTSIQENKGPDQPRTEIFQRSLHTNVLKTAGLLFVLGLSVIGSPLILGIVFVRGFVLGFTVGFLIQEQVVNGVILSTTSVLPHNLVAVPAILLAAGGALSFSGAAIKTMLGLSKEGVYGQFASTAFLSLLSSALLVIAALIETYLTPIFVQLTSGFLT